jgi:PLP dependent protein
MSSLVSVQKALTRAARDCNRDPASITLIAVSKTQPMEKITPLLEQGQRVFGENRVSEALEKWLPLREASALELHGLEIHGIGALQTNKVRDAFKIFDVLHTVDRESLAQEIARERDRQQRCPRLLVQVNTGAEPQKSGVLPDNLDVFLDTCRTKYALPIHGLMALPPADVPPSPHFAWLASKARDHGLPMLSMGMSADFEAAIQLGATHVRIGTALFGERECTSHP